MSKKKFDAYVLFISELNDLMYNLVSRIESKTYAKVRHANLQLVNDDRNYDLVQTIERKHEDVLRLTNTITPSEIYNWVLEIREIVEAYGPVYWSYADEFYEKVISSSLVDYLEEDVFMEREKSTIRRWIDYVQNLKNQKNDLEYEVNKLKGEKYRLESDVNSLITQQKKYEYNVRDLGQIDNLFSKRFELENKVKELSLYYEAEKNKIQAESDKLKRDQQTAYETEKHRIRVEFDKLKHDQQIVYETEKNKIHAELNKLKRGQRVASTINSILSKFDS